MTKETKEILNGVLFTIVLLTAIGSYTHYQTQTKYYECVAKVIEADVPAVDARQACGK